MNKSNSNVTFVSNLYPVERNNLVEDKEFCKHIEDFSRLFELKKNPLFKWFNFTKRQESIFYVQGGFTCKLNPDDKPFGAIIDNNGITREVCKCVKTDCKYFTKCKEMSF